MSLEEKRDPDLELELSRAKNLRYQSDCGDDLFVVHGGLAEYLGSYVCCRWGSLPIHNNLTIYHNRKASKISQDESFSSFLLESYASEVTLFEWLMGQLHWWGSKLFCICVNLSRYGTLEGLTCWESKMRVLRFLQDLAMAILILGQIV